MSRRDRPTPARAGLPSLPFEVAPLAPVIAKDTF